MRRCRWWEEGLEDGEPRLQGDKEGSLYEPRARYQMMQVGPEELEAQLARRAATRAPTAGVEYVRATGARGLREAGLLKGVRAMMARVYGGEDWYVNDGEGEGRVECLYEKKRKGERSVKFVVARLVDSDRWVAAAAEAEEVRTGAAEADGGMEGEPETPPTAAAAAAATPAAAVETALAAEEAVVPAAVAVAVPAATPAAVALAAPATGPVAAPAAAAVAVLGTVGRRDKGACRTAVRREDRQEERRGLSTSGRGASTSGQGVLTSGQGVVTSGQRALASGWRDDSQRAEGRQGQTGDQAGGQADGRRGACTTVLDGAAEEGQSGHEGREATGGGKKRKREGGEQVEDPEADGKGGAGRKRGRRGEREGEEAGGGTRQDGKKQRQGRKRSRGDG